MRKFSTNQIGAAMMLVWLLPNGLFAQLDTLVALNQHTNHFIKNDTIWMAAKRGVTKMVCSTGEVLATYTFRNSPLPLYSVSDVFVDDKSRMWLYVEGNGIAMLDGGNWTFWPPAGFNFPTGSGGSIFVDDEGTAWVSMRNHAPIYFFKNGNWQEAPNPNWISIDPIDMKTGPDGKMWVINSNNGHGNLLRHNGFDWEIMAEIPALIDFELAPGGGFYALTNDVVESKLYFYPNTASAGQLLGTLPPLGKHIEVGPDGKVWVAGHFAEGIAFLENGNWNWVPGIDPQFNFALSLDGLGRPWATDYFYGTKRWDGTAWQRIFTGPIAMEHGVSGGSDGSVWFGGFGTVSHYFPKTGKTEQRILDPSKPLFSGNTIAMAAGPNGSFYAANQIGALFWHDGAGNFTQTDEAAWNSFVKLAVDKKGALYYEGWDVFSDLIRFTPSPVSRQVITEYNNYDPAIPFDNYYGFMLDGRDRLWLSTNKGFCIWKNGSWQTFFEPSPIIDFPEFATAGKNGLWFFASNPTPQIQYFDGKDTVSWPMPLSGDYPQSFQADSRNWLWCRTNIGRLLCFNGLQWITYDAAMGNFPSFSFNEIFEDWAGDMWFIADQDLAFRLSVAGAKITGRLFDDTNEDCAVQSGEPSATGYSVVFNDGKSRIETVADEFGRFSANVPPGNYSVLVKSLGAFGQVCQSAIQVDLPNKGDSIDLKIPVRSVLDAPLLSVRMGCLTPLRRCMSATYFVNICNDGNLAADAPTVSVQLPMGLEMVGSNTAFSTGAVGEIIFTPGAVGAGDCRDFRFEIKVACSVDILLGQSFCLTAHVSPDTLPTIGKDAWTGATMVVKGACNVGRVDFTIQNTGPTTDAVLLEYAIMKDSFRSNTGFISLAGGGSKQLGFDADGSTFRFMMGQQPGHPFAFAPSVAVEGCLPTGSSADRQTGFVAQAANDSGSPFEATDCEAVIGSFDPNDKKAQPEGWGNAHNIDPGQLLRYTIRFQNTGTDTAFRVEIRDTLDAFLDWATIRPELASHPFLLEKDPASRALSFVFEKINLPDSTRDEAGSHGFVRFSVAARFDAPIGSEVKNLASIYFDINAPVLTNAVRHTIDTGFISKKPVEIDRRFQPIHVSPNPARSSVELSLDVFDAEKKHLVHVFGADGRLVKVVEMPGSPFVLEKEGLPTGLFRLAIWRNGKLYSVGEVVFID